VKAYYHARAAEYDDWWLGRERYEGRARPGFDDELSQVVATLAGLRPARTLDIACGTGFLTRHLPGEITGIDQSGAMLELAREQAPEATFVGGDALALPFGDGAFERAFASFFYCHLVEEERVLFLSEARRVASELLVLASKPGGGDPRARWEERVLDDGSRWEVFKRVFEGDELAAELGGGRVLHEGRWFVLVSSP
jgi:ubiquinone/menaquinone biosynthesis C-methylase UbiE